MVGSSVGRSLPTPLYVQHASSRVSGPPQAIMDLMTKQVHHPVLLSPNSPKEPWDENAPESPIGKKHKVVETRKPIHHHKI